MAQARFLRLLALTASLTVCLCAAGATGLSSSPRGLPGVAGLGLDALGVGGPSTATATASSCANTTLAPSSGNIAQIRAAVLCLINQERERYDESVLAPNTTLTSAAQQHSGEMADEDYFSHVAPDGQTPLDRMRASGYLSSSASGYVVGENIAWGTMWLATPQAIVNAWMASPEHRANILDASFRETGVGVEPRPPAALAEGQPGALYTQDFGSIVLAGHSSRRSAADVGRITSGTHTHGKRSRKHHGSTRRQSRHRHRVRARHRARHRRAARRTRRKRAHQRPRRRHRTAGR